MATHYWVGDFFIDLTRNQITQKTQSQTIPPKALAVLTYLAKNANKVVSHEKLLSEVWPDTVVTPNTLQRSIAQLRKALGEDSQSYIKTHAKQGYSLEVEVRWQDKTEPDPLIDQDSVIELAQADKIIQPNSEMAENTSAVNFRLRLLFIFAGMVILGLIGFKYVTPEHPLKLSFTELRSLTATDNKEHSAIYSPDGEHIVFLRYSEEFCMSSNIWAKNIKTQKETQLTKNIGRYDNPSFSKDGKKLVFIKTENCDQPITQKQCYKLMTLDFENALEAPQVPNLLMECKNSRISKAKWLNNNNIALLQEFNNRWKLISYSIADNKSTDLFELKDGNFFDYDYSASDDLIALTSIHNDGLHYLEILKPDGQILSSHRIKYPPEIPSETSLFPNFISKSEQLIFSTGRQLFTLSYKGEITNISLPLDEPMGSPVFHPEGKRALVIKGNWDSDIATISMSQLSELQTGAINSDSLPAPKVLERSTLAEDNAIYQPHGKLIAFISDRSGEDQIWTTDDNSAKQLTHFPIDTNLSGMDWASDGMSILVNANYKLTQVFLNSDQKDFSFDHPIAQLFHWSSVNNTALITTRIKGIVKFGELNLNNSEFRVITEKTVSGALKSEDGRLIYADKMDRFWQPGPAEDQLIELLNGQGSGVGFIIKNNIIYGVNEEFQFWAYDLDEDTFEIRGNLPKNTDLLSDLNQTDILLTLRITAKKEVAELHLNE